ncbi:hypothetical protein A0O34_00690 [Chryseobacterium glaciei]|uniref:Uncharacterized protein n=1 Tax=Chryseobacterium glaciei TaxID=1685010 RepID=A0A172XQQ8_9FLAO|nr:hypothetical protein [Chryseobacterium glaciei]ANF49162.1 hypothetical protein A0O34_00690 [Chryseobacterium glaciei]
MESFTDGIISEEKLKKNFNEISFKFGDLEKHDIDHFLLGNPVQEKPFIQVTENDTIFNTSISNLDRSPILRVVKSILVFIWNAVNIFIKIINIS